ncbi:MULTISPECIES: hypothetical protein [Pseudomonas]|uniref:Lipoprotein n=1 Tax=Pseudomonas gessardii TaxID=78544 RepID=A0A7Y1MQV7_9PSED|nr:MULTISPECIES: hypothetical protein [Pseudomonas]MBH3425622.1 hypothetical protein [Pseudomonas gessardii]MCF4981494.1 hypothetical protein [Pseudomonas gessardii]MCF4992015.1 hypothetical protein [Pseudomonas gessardii]MCF5086739.1 hypothetical protein [Pseudomonas gessardii]MCF5098214.1 hypothetical protein [Pseudomonas gessardii]
MNRLLSVALLLAASFLAGCATHPAPELRPYSAEETRQLAMEALNRRGLSFDDYQQQKAKLAAQPQKPFGFDRQGEMNAERNVTLPGRPS